MTVLHVYDPNIFLALAVHISAGLSKVYVRHDGGRRTKNLQGEREKRKRMEERKKEQKGKMYSALDLARAGPWTHTVRCSSHFPRSAFMDSKN